jgi:uncharacterized repeat protein (TIGR01451 family)
MKKLILLTLLSLTTLLSNAQYETIPDSNFVKFLQIEFPSAMSGNQMDTSASVIINATTVNCIYSRITNLQGIQYFDSLQVLNCGYNQIDSLPDLNSNLKKLYCNNNYSLKSLPPLPNSLTYLNCSANNVLDSLPKLPDSLKVLYCGSTKITRLPTLPNSLDSLNCWNLLVTSLPTLPNSLKYLNCDNNILLTSLPVLPSSLINLQCHDNDLSSLPQLPSSLQVLWCSDNTLTNLPALPSSLLSLRCPYNQITRLPALPNSLEFLNCIDNKLATLPSLPSSLALLYCGENELTSLPTLPSSITAFSCYKNQLTSLPSLPSKLKWVSCHQNMLTSLPNLPESLISLLCINNKLTSLPPLPSSLEYLYCTGNPQLTCLPYFSQNTFVTFEVKTGTKVKCIPRSLTVSYSGDGSGNLPICNSSSSCPIAYGIKGNVHQDTSNNCALDSLKNGLLMSGIKMSGYLNNQLKWQTYTDINGYYSFEADMMDSVTIQIDTINSSFVSCPSSGTRTVNITATDTLFTNQNFGVKCSGVDLGVSSIQGTFRPTRNRPVCIKAGDLSQQFNLDCADNVSGTVTTTIIGSANYVAPLSGALSPTSVVGKTLTYTISDFGVIDLDSSFSIIINTDTNATVGSDICVKTKVSTSASDINSMNDSLLFCGEVVNSYDPNDKAAFPSDVATPDSWITYTIRYQNTGTDTAYDIIIRDTLSTHLDESTFTYLDGSVRPVVSLNQKAIMFNYPHINLLDSFSNEPESHGWLQYKVQTVADLPPFAEVKNTAYIYFDLNSAVVTNTTTNEYVTRSSQDITSCDSAIVNGEIYTSTHTIIDTLGPEVTTTNLVINQSTSRAQSFTSCDSFSYQGSIYYTSLIIRDTFSTVLGCDSLVLTNLTINSVDSKTTLSGATISSSQTGAAYQWLDCDSASSIILSETNQSYTATQNGEYAVEVSQNGCMDTSFCVSITTLGITENSLADVFKIYPNPTAGNITIAFDENQSQIQARVLSITGQELATHNASNTNTLQFDFEAAKGIYFVEITTETRGTSVVRVVKQ